MKHGERERERERGRRERERCDGGEGNVCLLIVFCFIEDRVTPQISFFDKSSITLRKADHTAINLDLRKRAAETVTIKRNKSAA